MHQQDSLIALFEVLLNIRDCNRNNALESEEFRFLKFATSLLHLSRSQLLQDLWVLFELNRKNNGYFVEIGAADGEFLSNTHILETQFGWTGSLSEPNPVWHDKLYRSRKAFISQCCISDRSHETAAFIQTPLPEYSTFEEFVESDSCAHYRTGGKRQVVNTLTLCDFLAMAGAPRRIDYLSIDTEGSEFKILSDFDFKRYQISIITVEHNYTANRKAIEQRLTDEGFTRKFEKFSRWDDWYINKFNLRTSLDDYRTTV